MENVTVSIWAGLALGFLGSAHCVGMCGPIVLALPGSDAPRFRFIIYRLLYNFGRVITYAILGIVIGLLGEKIKLAGYHQILSVTMGVLILIGVLTPSRYVDKLINAPVFGRIGGLFRSLWRRFFGQGGYSSHLLIGILNGFLPCGFVYIALAGAVATGSMVSSALYMSLFGLGTIPIMLATSLVGGFVTMGLRNRLRRLMPVAATIVAVILILRGLSLGIPYISPKAQMIELHQDRGDMSGEKCH